MLYTSHQRCERNVTKHFNCTSIYFLLQYFLYHIPFMFLDKLKLFELIIKNNGREILNWYHTQLELERL